MFCIAMLLTVFPANVSCVANAVLLTGGGSMSTPSPKPKSVIALKVFELDAIVNPQPALLVQFPAVKLAARAIVTSGLPSPVTSPLIVTPPPVSAGSCERSVNVAPANDGAKSMTYVPGLAFVASIASRNEIPSGPGSATKALTLDVSPLTTSCVDDTTIVTALAAVDATGVKADETTRPRTATTPMVTALVTLENGVAMVSLNSYPLLRDRDLVDDDH